MLLTCLLGLSLCLETPVLHGLDIVNSCDVNYCPYNVTEQQKYDEMTTQIREKLLEKKGIVYRLGCNGEHPCKPNGYDCSGLIDSVWRDVGFYEGRKLNGGAIKQAGKKVTHSEIETGMYLYMENLGDGPNHIAFIDSTFDGVGFWVLDAVADTSRVTRRYIQTGKDYYIGSEYRAYFIKMDYTKELLLNKGNGRYYQN